MPYNFQSLTMSRTSPREVLGGADGALDTGQDSGKSPKQFQRVSRNLLDRTGADWVIAMYPQASQSSAR